MTDPYAALGVRYNPFLAEPQPGVEAHLWVERGYVPPVPNCGCLLQVCGVRGAGKTSLLLHWRERMPGPYHYVAPGWKRWQIPPLGPIAYWDELDRLPRPLLLCSLLRARAANTTIVAGTHVSLSWAAALCGMPTTTIAIPSLTPSLLLAWARLRIEAARCGTSSALGLVIDDNTATRIAAEAGASWRVAADLLHIWAAEQARGDQRGVNVRI